MRLRKMLSIRSVVEDTLREMGYGSSLQQHRIFGVWKEVVGPRISPHAQPITFRAGLLIVAVEDSMWLHQLHLFKHRILTDLQARLPEVCIRDMVLRVGAVRGVSGDQLPGEGSTSPEPRLRQEEREKIEEILSPLSDGECREVVGRILSRHLGKTAPSR
jgi:predicted nucleic acid-binding Zn ribbon protein